ncbi:hypothetical protein [Cupriavidus lacunae]|uniref:hypothetical protein n=1 Tax=Cupriavidus lacunae TaxID=2666307 RepID=UPI001058BF01|nr:hypothetical protein [Cupriavidus lacunae]
MNCYLVRRLFPAVCWVAAVAVAVPDEAFAQSPKLEWRFYGGAKLPEKEMCFYDAAGVTRGATRAL